MKINHPWPKIWRRTDPEHPLSSCQIPKLNRIDTLDEGMGRAGLIDPGNTGDIED
jgi:hypothetical protein